MWKVPGLLLVILLSIASMAGYLFLNEKIAAGERQIADGQRRLNEKYLSLKDGKAELGTT